MGKIDSRSWLGAWFHLPPSPAAASFLNQKRTLFPERAWLAALRVRPAPRHRRWCSLSVVPPALAGNGAGGGLLFRGGQGGGGVCSSSLLPPLTWDVPGMVPSSEGEVRAAQARLNFAGMVLVSLPAIDPAAGGRCPGSVWCVRSAHERHEALPRSPPVTTREPSGVGS